MNGDTLMKKHIILVSLLIAGPVAAEGPSLGWSYKAILGAEREPAYTGSDEYVVGPNAYFEAAYTTARGQQYFIGLGGVGMRFSPADDWVAEIALEYEPGRDNADDPILAHFAEHEDTVELQAFLIKEYGDWSVGTGLQYDLLDRGKGLVGFIGAGYERDLTEKLSFELQGNVSFANSDHMNTEVGVTSAVSALSGLAEYDAGSGYKSATLKATMEYELTDVTSLYTSFAVESYGSNMADSPLIAVHGSDVTTELSAGVALAF